MFTFEVVFVDARWRFLAPRTVVCCSEPLGTTSIVDIYDYMLEQRFLCPKIKAGLNRFKVRVVNLPLRGPCDLITAKCEITLLIWVHQQNISILILIYWFGWFHLWNGGFCQYFDRSADQANSLKQPFKEGSRSPSSELTRSRSKPIAVLFER